MYWKRRKADDSLTESTIVVAVSVATIRRAERAIMTCQRCNGFGADTPFRDVLARANGIRRATVEYFLSEPAHCPHCFDPVFEHTLVETA